MIPSPDTCPISGILQEWRKVEVQVRIGGVGTVQLVGSALLIHPYLLGGTLVRSRRALGKTCLWRTDSFCGVD